MICCLFALAMVAPNHYQNSITRALRQPEYDVTQNTNVDSA